MLNSSRPLLQSSPVRRGVQTASLGSRLAPIPAGVAKRRMWATISLAALFLGTAGAAAAQNNSTFNEAGRGRVNYTLTSTRPAADCAALRSRLTQVEGATVTIIKAEPVAATSSSPAFCRVVGVIAPEVLFEVALPDVWNRRLYMRGNGGYTGERLTAPDRVALRNKALSKGFVAAQTNTGHDAAAQPLATFAEHDLAKLADYSFRAIHLTANAAKALTAAYYSRPPAYSYFDGCSTGGRQGLMSAQRFPDDFDGIAVGAPVNDWTGQLYWHAWNAQHLAKAPFTPEQIARVGKVVMDLCDAADGLKDGLITDPRACRFDPKRDLPRGGRNGFSEGQMAALEAVYGGVKVDGQTVFPGQLPGAEPADAQGVSGWVGWLVANPNAVTGGQPIPRGQTRQYAYGEQFLRYFAEQPASRPDLDLRTFDFDKEYKSDGLIYDLLDATNPDLSKFKSHGGKIVFYHGWADTALNPLSSIHYYDSVRSVVPDTESFLRLFMVPGMFHCRGGLGPDDFDPVTTLIDWVEAGQAPDVIIARQHPPTPQGAALGPVIRTRPLCPYPEAAVYKGGDAAQASSFACGEAPARAAAASEGARSPG